MKRYTYIVMSIVAAGVLAGCNDSSTKAQGADSFTKEVQKVVATSSDTTSPVSIDSVTAVNADTAAPVAVY